MNHRSYLKNRITLYGESSGKLFERSFSIVRVISEGADGVCYEAYHRTSGKGVLKEFYPEKFIYLLDRNGEGYLEIPEEFCAAAEEYREAGRKFIEPYEMLLGIKQSSDDRDISSFVPYFEFYRGGPAEEADLAGPIYIWTPEPELETFEKICREIHRHPAVRPEHKLVTVLSAVETLAKCVCALHSAGIVHRDIKPQNFGFIKRRGETLTQAISLFDIDSLCSVWEEAPDAIRTEGYSEPEAGYREFSNQTDIYSIGATLFHAVIVTEETRKDGFIYREKYYERLKEMVSESELITASEANSHPRLKNALTVILRRCLCGRKRRYQNCEELIADIREAIFYALPPDIARKSRRGGRWILAEAERSLDIHSDKNSALAVLYRLYERPLYENLMDGETELNILVLGFQNYGQKFLDACLQMGQMRNIHLHVTVAADDETDRDIYLSERPGLSGFFTIGESSAEEDASYGKISFIYPDPVTGDHKSGDLLNTAEEAVRNRHLHYVFIAAGDDSVNFRTASELRKALNRDGTGCTICYAVEGEDLKYASSDPDMVPVFVNHNARNTKHHKELERMAFNTHLVWEKSLDLDSHMIRKEFRKTYNHDACISSAVALKYRLAGLGIDIDDISPEEAAGRFSEATGGSGGRPEEIRDELIWIEHRRWVTEKLCRGWTCLTELDSCISGTTRDERNKQHICLLRSRPDQRLFRLSQETGCSWDDMTEEDYGKLDDLDRLSVRLHRIYSEKAASIRESKLLRNTLLSGIKTNVEGNAEALRTFNEWYSCISRIWKGDRTKIRLYRSRKEAFLEAAGRCDPDGRRAIIQQVKAFDSFFYPVLASLEFKDWKQEDAELIDSIPFILTYTDKITLVIPFDHDDTPEAVFSNVSAAALIRPARIIYLCQIDRKADARELMGSLSVILKYMENRRIKASLDFIILAKDRRSCQGLEEEIRKTGNGKVKSVRILEGREQSQIGEIRILLKGDGRRSVTAAEVNSTELSARLDAGGFYEQVPHFSFDSVQKSFTASKGCELLRYIRKDVFIKAEDLALFDKSLSIRDEVPEFIEDYEDLWDRYIEDTETWKNLCGMLREYAACSDCLAEFRRNDDRAEPEDCRYILPAMSWFGAEEAVKQLESRDILSGFSVSAGHSTDSCILKFTDSVGAKEEYDRLFSNVYALSDPSALTVRKTDGGSIGVWFDDLVVSNMTMKEGAGTPLRKLIGYFADKGYFIAVRYGEKTVSFTYASRQIKRLLTSPWSILELYTYHYARNLDIFDDVVLGTVNGVDCPGPGAPCCIMTKGFTSLIVVFGAEDACGRLPTEPETCGINGKMIAAADFLK